ncbi:MAG: glycosyltransferase [Tepidisphaeraceae bacterium]
MIDLSIVLPTCNRATLLRDATACDHAQTACSYEIIVVDGASTDATHAVLEPFQQQFGERMTVFREPSRRGFVKAANLGLRAARGRNVCWINDDARPVGNALDVAVAAVDASPRNVLAMFHRWHSPKNVAYTADFGGQHVQPLPRAWHALRELPGRPPHHVRAARLPRRAFQHSAPPTRISRSPPGTAACGCCRRGARASITTSTPTTVAPKTRPPWPPTTPGCSKNGTCPRKTSSQTTSTPKNRAPCVACGKRSGWRPSMSIAMKHPPRVSFVLSTYNRRDALLSTLAQVFAVGGEAGEFDIHVVDNASTDGTSTSVLTLFPDVKLLRTPRQPRFGREEPRAAERGTGSTSCSSTTTRTRWPGSIRTDDRAL